jgi:hypothetical protein
MILAFLIAEIMSASICFFDRIAARLNEEKVSTRTGKPWHGVVVNRILTGKR